MDDKDQVKMISSLDFDISKVNQTMKNLDSIFEKNMQELEKKARASVNNINNALKNIGGQSQLAKDKFILDQYGGVLKNISTEQSKINLLQEQKTKEMQKQLDLLKKQATEGTKQVADGDGRASPFMARMETALSYGMIYKGIQATKEATKTISEVEMGITEIARVTEDASFNFDKVRDKVIQLGIDYGQSFENVQDISLRWAQAGYNIADTLELTKTSLLALNTAELDAQNATESLIGIMAQWNLTAKELPLVLDKINKVGDDFTVTSQDLVDGLLRSSGAAKIMGLSLEQNIALLTTMREASGRTGREVGNALNSILSYIQRAGSIKVIESMGIRMFADEARTQFRNVFEVFQELATKWNDPNIAKGAKDALMAGAQEAGLFAEELANVVGIQDEYNQMTDAAAKATENFTDTQKRDAAQAAAGVYRRNYFIGLLEKFATTQEVLISMNEAEGYSMRENERTMGTLEKKVQSLKTSYTQLAVAIGEAGLLDSLKDLADLGTEAIEVFDKLDPPIKNFIINLGVIYGTIKAIKVTANLFGLEKAIAGIGGVLSGPVWTALIGISALIITIRTEMRKAAEEKQKLLEGAGEEKAEIENLETMVKKYEELSAKAKDNNEAKGELLSLQKQLAEIYPQYADSISDEGDKLVTNIGLLKEYNQQKEKELELKTLEMVEKAPDRIKQLKKDIATVEEFIEKQKQILSGNTASPIEKDTARERLGKAVETLAEYRYELALNEKFLQKNTLDVEAYEDAILKAAKGIDTETDAINANTGAKADNAEANEEFIKAFNEHISNMQTYKTMLDEINSKEGLSNKSKQDIITKYQQFIPYLSDEKSLREQLAKAIDDEDKAQKKLYLSKVENEETFYTTMLTNNKTLVDKLEEGYNVDLSNYKNLAEAKRQIDILWLQEASERWYRFYDITTDTLQGLSGTIGVGQSAELSKLSVAVDKIRAFNKEMNSIALKGTDFKSGLSTKKSSTTNTALQEYLRQLNHKKAMDKLSIEEEIAGYEYALKHYAKTVDEKMGLTEKIYSTKKRLIEEEKKSEEELGKIVEDTLKNQLDSLKEAYDKRTKMIDEETNKKKKAQQDIIDGIDKEIEAMNRREKGHDHERKLADLNEKLRYHQMRTGVEHEEAIKDIEKQIAEENHDYQNELMRQSLDDKKQAAQDEIKNIEDNAEEQKTVLKKTLDSFDSLFNGSNKTIISAAMAMSREYSDIVNNMIETAKKAIRESNITDEIEGYDKVSGIVASGKESQQIKSYVSAIVDYKRQYNNAAKAGNKEAMNSAYESAKRYYNLLESSEKGKSFAEQLQRMNYEQARELLKNATFHTGGKNMREGLALIRRDEIMLNPRLSEAFEKFTIMLSRTPMQTIRNVYKSSSSKSESKSVSVDKAVNIEHAYFEDDTDIEIFGREMKRVIEALP